MDNNLNMPPFEDLTEVTGEPGYIRIRFGDYFDIRQPHYKSLDQLDRKNCYYLADAWDKLCQYINNPMLDHIPNEVLESLRFWDIGRYDTLINVNGDVVDLSSHDVDYGERWHGIVPSGELDVGRHSWLCKISALNNVVLDDSLDIEASIIYNLYEIVPLTNLITIDFLRYYFWCDKNLDIQRREFEEKGEAPSLGTLFLLWVEKQTSDELEEDTGGLVRSMLDCDILKDGEADLESFEKHEEIIANHNAMLEEESRKHGTLYLKAAFGAPYYEQLRQLELQVINKITIEAKNSDFRRDPSSYTGFISELEHFEVGLHSIKADGIRKVYNLPLKVIEVILRAKLWYKLGSNVVYDGIMMNEMINILRDNWDYLCKVKYTYQEKNQFIQSLRAIKTERNIWAHGSKGYTIDEANKIMQRLYSSIKDINRFI